MDRKQYLDMCQKVSMYKPDLCGIIMNLPNELFVMAEGRIYYPLKYVLGFENGKPTHTAILHDLRAGSISEIDLEKVITYEQGRDNLAY